MRPVVLTMILVLAIGLIVAVGILGLRVAPDVGTGPGDRARDEGGREVAIPAVSADDTEAPATTGANQPADPEIAPPAGDLSLAGQVVDRDWRPVAGAEIRIRSRSGVRPGTLRTGEDGRFRLDGLAAGRHRVWAKAPFFSSRTVRALAGTVDLALVLDRAGEIRVVLAGPEAIDGAFPPARVELLDTDGGVEDWLDNEEDRGPEILFEGVPPGRYRVRAVVFGAGAVQRSGVEVREGERTEVPLSIEEGTVLEGRVVAAEGGAPVAGAFVVVGEGDEPSWGLRLTTGERFAWLNGGNWARSGGDGRFRIPGLLPGRWTLAAAAPGFDPTARIVDLPPRGKVEIRLPVGASLTVAVLDRAGRPVEGADVLVGFPTSGGAHTTETDAAGTARFPGLPPGEVSVLVSLVRAWSMGASVVVPAGETVRKTFRLPAAAAVLTGRVTRTGHPEVDRRVTVESRALGVTWEASTDADGRYRLDALPVGDTRVRVWPSRARHEITLTDGENTLDVRLPSAGIRVRIVDHRTGRPIDGARVSGARYAHADAEGRVDLPALEAVEQTLVVLASGYAPGRVSVIPTEENPEVVVRLARGALLRLKIVDPSGNEVSSPDVSVRDDSGWRLGGHASDDEAPIFRLAAGTYTVMVEHPDFAPWGARIEFGETDETETITLQPR